jgi:SPP1 gp7 family putative phage head morphogenesis protein
MKQLAALPLKDKYFKAVRAEIQRIFDELIYKPIHKAIKSVEITNSMNSDPLYEAIKEGRVWYEDGRFWGKFNARISKRLQEIGATYNPKSKTWSYSGALPAEVSLASAVAATRYTKLREAVLQSLSTIGIESINNISNIPDVYDQTIKWINDDFRKAVAAITIPPQLTQEQVNIIAVDWAQNLDLYIRKWTDENILKLRQMVQSNAFAGKRAESMIEAIQKNYQVSKRKAEFLARQETSLLMSKFHETRFNQIGMPFYRWSTSNDERVRHDHELLDGHVYRWDDPPVVDRAAGRKGNPGEDFGCRCVAIPIVGNIPR